MTIDAVAESSDPNERVSRASLREQVTHQILLAVFQRRFVSGQRLVVQRLAEQYGVSPTPVRESLVELAGLGIVDLLLNRGAVVRPFGPLQLQQMSQVRRVLEVEAARSACGKINPAALESLRAELQRLQQIPQDDEWDKAARQADTKLHALIANGSGNPRLAKEIKRYLMLFQSLRNVSHFRDSFFNYRRSNDVPEHLAIVEALISGDATRAADAMDQHIRSITEVLNEVVDSPDSPDDK